MPSTDRATALRDVLTRLYPDDNAISHLNTRAPGLYDRLIGGADDQRAFGELAGLFPDFGAELTRYYDGAPAGPVWGGLRGFPIDAGEGTAPTGPSPTGVSGYETNALDTTLSLLSFLPVIGPPLAQTAKFVNSLPSVQSVMSQAFPLTNELGIPVVGHTPLGKTPATSLLSLLGIDVSRVPTEFSTEQQLDVESLLGLANPGVPTPGVDGGVGVSGPGAASVGTSGMATGIGMSGLGIGLGPGDPSFGAPPGIGFGSVGVSGPGDGPGGGGGTGPGEGGAGGTGGAGTGEGSDGSGNYRRGGFVRDLMRLPDGAERITAHEGEYVVNAKATRTYGPLLDAINRGVAPKKVRRLAAAMVGE